MRDHDKTDVDVCNRSKPKLKTRTCRLQNAKNQAVPEVQMQSFVYTDTS